MERSPESLNLSDEDVDKLLKLKVHNGKEEMVRVVGHPKGWVDMRESEGKARWEQPLTSQEIIYHLANTLQGSSGSPIIADRRYIIGTHTRGASVATGGANSGVRMRKELLPFIEDSIAKHQAFLESMEALEALRAKERQDAEQALIDRGMAQGEAKGEAKGRAEGEKAAKVEIARGMLSDKMPIATIIKYTGLTEEEISALKI